ncbi:MAG: extracellular solute-binding protein, partial [Dolichospermum sp.]|nr:extracellular solute-binding protein [Dolichospermum sp.]
MIRLQKFKQLGCLALLGLLTSWIVSWSTSNVSNNPKPAATGVATIEFWTMQLQPQFTNYFQSLITTFESQNPSIKVKWVDVPWAGMENKILTAVSAK